MTVNEERKLFLTTIKNYFRTHPNIKVNKEYTYSQIIGNKIFNNGIEPIPRDSLVNVQYYLNEKFKNIKGINTFIAPHPTNDFLVIENRCQKDDKTFREELNNSLKIYVSIDLTNIYEIVSKVIEYINRENITVQAKVAKHMRSDAFVIRVADKEKIDKLIEYINNLDYKTNIKPNPFALNVGRVSITKDGKKSYNCRLSSYIAEYLETEKKEVSLENFKKYMYEKLNKSSKEDQDEYMIMTIIIKNLEETLTLEELKQYKKVPIKTEKNDIITDIDKNNAIHLINKLNLNYNLEDVHKIIEKYIQDNNINYFTRQNGVRKLVDEHLVADKLERTLSEMGWNALVNAVNETYQKYGDRQVEKALKEILTEQKISSLTNEKDVRSYLGFIVSPNMLKNIIIKKSGIRKENIEEKDWLNIIQEKTKDMIYAEIEYNQRKKISGRNWQQKVLPFFWQNHQYMIKLNLLQKELLFNWQTTHFLR